MPQSVIEKLQKILKLEIEYGFENKAVVGGLEKFMPSWAAQAQGAGLDSQLIDNVFARLNDYRLFDQENRAQTINKILDLLNDASQAKPAVHSHDSSPLQNVEPSSLPAQSLPRQLEPITKSPQISSSPQLPASRQVQQQPGGLKAPLTVLHGIGPKNAELLETVGLRTLEDLLYYFPRRYDDYSQMKTINRLEYGQELSVIGSIYSISNRAVRGGALQITEAVIGDGTGFLRATWFNQPWLANRIPAGTQLILSGKIEMYLGRLVMTSPEWEFLDQEHLHTNRIVPVYSLSGRLTQKVLRRLMHQTVNFWAPRTSDFLPEAIRKSAGLMDLPNALNQIHFPDSADLLRQAQARLAFDEIFLLQLGVLQQKKTWQQGTAKTYAVSDEWLDNQIAQLPFTLTNAQQKVLAEVRRDLTTGRPMNRLLQGDVGSGKTVVAALGIAIVNQGSGQSALMAPTSILAEQHFRNLNKLLVHEGSFTEGEIALLVGDTPNSEKAAIRLGLEENRIRLVIGTHALLEEPVSFHNLQLAIIDEQHRFGVAQRSILRSKGSNPHLMVMTATPIPRSLALTIYGDLDLSVMDEMPVGRLPVETHVLHPLERERAYQLIRNQIASNRQVFIIYPLVEKGERDEGKAAVEGQAHLQKEVFPKLKVGLVHGRLKPDQKDEVMRKFRDGEYQILVSTSVVEVGVDVPNATVMLIEGANRFGLSQLHQFRGRVGRSSEQSYCLLIPEDESSLENERLAAMEQTTDGFVLAEKDLEQRGPGDFLGTRQSGFADLRMANLMDVRLIEKARQHALEFFELDPDFGSPEFTSLFQRYQHFWAIGRGDIS